MVLTAEMGMVVEMGTEAADLLLQRLLQRRNRERPQRPLTLLSPRLQLRSLQARLSKLLLPLPKRPKP